MSISEGVTATSTFRLGIRSAQPLGEVLAALRGYAETHGLDYHHDPRSGVFEMVPPQAGWEFMVQVRGTVTEAREGCEAHLRLRPIVPVIALGVFGLVATVALMLDGDPKWVAVPIVMLAGGYIFLLHLQTVRWELVETLLPGYARSAEGLRQRSADMVGLMRMFTRPIYALYAVLATGVVALAVLWGLRIIELEDVLAIPLHLFGE